LLTLVVVGRGIFDAPVEGGGALRHGWALSGRLYVSRDWSEPVDGPRLAHRSSSLQPFLGGLKPWPLFGDVKASITKLISEMKSLL
jgi:hypothetical protein